MVSQMSRRACCCQAALEGITGKSPVSIIAGYRTRIGAMQVCAVSGESEQDTNRFTHGSETQLYRSHLRAASSCTTPV